MEFMNEAALGGEQAQRSCKHLGVCQSRSPACADCPHIHFAPGVIDFGKQRKRSWYAKVGGIALEVFTILAIFFTSWFAVGLFGIWMGWL